MQPRKSILAHLSSSPASHGFSWITFQVKTPISPPGQFIRQWQIFLWHLKFHRSFLSILTGRSPKQGKGNRGTDRRSTETSEHKRHWPGGMCTPDLTKPRKKIAKGSHRHPQEDL